MDSSGNLPHPIHRAGRVKHLAGLSRLWPAVFLAAALGSVVARAQESNSNYGQSFGTVSLVAGQRQQVWMGATYRLVRVCNDFNSAGTVTAIIDDQPALTLPPGRCAEDYGNRIQFVNNGGGTATVAYRSITQAFIP